MNIPSLGVRVAAALLVVLAGLARPEAPLSAAPPDDPPKAPSRPLAKPKARGKAKIDIPSLIELHNEERAAEKLPPLTANPKLEAAAKAHAQDMATHHKMQHEGFDGSAPADRVKTAGYRFQRAGENVAEGQASSAEVIRDWMNSPHHRANILGDYTEIGASCIKDDDGIPFWCVVFGKPWPELDADKAAAGLIAALNKARAEADPDAPPLKAHPILRAAAQTHADSVAKAGKFVAKDDDGLTLHERARKAGYNSPTLGESDAMGQTSPEDVVKSWLDSQGSRKLLGKPEFRDVGVGLAKTKDNVPCWVVLLGVPPDEDP